ncbi:tetraspanin-10 isoform X2 [Trichosurus vulpecula]|uniref:tetraspanin-10 isoform X2 n=1 Tax=Trichosurus vulpecula TaxID=9337 RepID=UPI00186ABC80|nr:tetraspanin-10 isoform X2 [Trichosurus vulpecula]
MVEGERTQLLPKEAGCDEPPSLSCNYTVRVLEPIPKKYNAGPSGWGCLPPETLAGILIYALWDQLQEIVDSTMLLAITRYQDDSDLRFLLDEIQLGLQCYGVVSYQDWKLNLYFNCSSPGVQACGLPASCCINPWENGTIINSQCGFGALHLDETTAQNIVHSEGCSPRLRQWLGRNSWVIRDCILVITVIEGLEFLLVTKLVRDIKVRKVND